MTSHTVFLNTGFHTTFAAALSGHHLKSGFALLQSTGAVVTESQTYKRRADFLSNDDYAVYVRENVQVSGCRGLRAEPERGRWLATAMRLRDVCCSSIPISDILKSLFAGFPYVVLTAVQLIKSFSAFPVVLYSL